MDFKRKALGVAMGAVAAVAMSLTAVPASANVMGDAYYSAADGHAKVSRAEKRAARGDRNKHDRRQDPDKPQWSDGTYSRDVDRTKDADTNSVGRETTITNTETGNSVTRDRETSRDPETGAITHTDTVTGPNGNESKSTETTLMKTDDGRMRTTTVTKPDGTTTSRSVDVSKDADAAARTKSVTTTGPNGGDRTHSTTTTKTDDGFDRTTTFDGGAQTDVHATYNPDTGKWERDVNRTRDDDNHINGSAGSQVDSADQVTAPPTKD